MTEFRKELIKIEKEAKDSGLFKTSFQLLQDINTKEWFIGNLASGIELSKRSLNKSRVQKIFDWAELGLSTTKRIYKRNQ
tara:strand:- start:667 stop:906 length:240 start_codon:yes stop_codon:yes gene_type:complete